MRCRFQRMAGDLIHSSERVNESFEAPMQASACVCACASLHTDFVVLSSRQDINVQGRG